MMEAVIRSLTRRDDTMVYLFGSKGREGNILSFFADKYRNLESVVGKYDLAGELALISTLNLMIAMDSANMHFASLAGTRVVSIWGATSPDTGFMAYNSNPDDIIQLDMPCRPCSVFGQKKCATNDRACMKNITPEMIITKIESILGPDPRLLKKSVK